MKTFQGDLIHLAQNGEFDLIALDCNCFCTMGAGGEEERTLNICLRVATPGRVERPASKIVWKRI